MDNEDIIITYQNNTLLFEKNSFLTSKSKINLVYFIVKDLSNNEIFRLENQEIKKYWIFYISNLALEKKVYKLEIYNSENNQKIYNNLFEIK